MCCPSSMVVPQRPAACSKKGPLSSSGPNKRARSSPERKYSLADTDSNSRREAKQSVSRIANNISHAPNSASATSQFTRFTRGGYVCSTLSLALAGSRHPDVR
jgi:hypothetical protein